ncbi:MAG: hypothetical protein LC799_05455, partial [Actinobacteria bacterium]|nr:hypothetical protein [Actinomycetota bacterium]
TTYGHRPSAGGSRNGMDAPNAHAPSPQATFSPHGATMAAASNDQTVRLGRVALSSGGVAWQRFLRQTQAGPKGPSTRTAAQVLETYAL